MHEGVGFRFKVPTTRRLEALLRLAARVTDAPQAQLCLARPVPKHLALGAPPRGLARRCGRLVAGAAPWIATDTAGEPGLGDLVRRGIRSVAAVTVRAPDGTPVGTLCVAAPTPRPAGLDAATWGLLADVADLAGALAAAADAVRPAWGRAETAIAPAVRRDALTGLPERDTVRRLLRRCLADPGPTRRVAVHIVGLDHFHELNEDHGHLAGDAVLRLVAGRLRAETRAEDAVARIGGDEFTVVQPALDRPADARALAARLVAIVRAPITFDGAELRVTASVGTAVGPDDGADGDALPTNANLAMRRAKAAGGDRACTFDAAVDPATRARRERRRDLDRAIAEDVLDVRFQPKVTLATGRMAGAEALVRWFTPAGEEVPPDDFIPIAEESGLIVPLGRAVLARACHAAADWPNAGAVAVNLSPVQLERDDVVAMVEHALAHSGLPPHRLELEVTEQVLLEDVDRVASTLGRLRDLGVALALDDFGSGYLSFAMLRRLPLDTLKLDRSFARALDLDPRAADVVAGMVAMAHRLGLATVAEGVETAGQRDLLRRLGCDLGQGFFFGRPAAVPMLEADLRARRAHDRGRGRASRSRARSAALVPPGSA